MKSSVTANRTQIKPVNYPDRARKLRLMLSLNRPEYFGYQIYKLSETLYAKDSDSGEESEDDQEAQLRAEEEKRREAIRDLKRFRGGKSIQEVKTDSKAISS